MARRAGSGRDETERERVDRNLSELLQELRVALPGVQVLFAFLLTIPFAQGFDRLNGSQEKLYFAVLLCTAVSTVFLIAPTAHHRLLFRLQDKEHLVITANRYAIAGLGVLAVAIAGALFLIGDLLFGLTTTIAATAGFGLLLLSVWYALPLRRRASLPDRDQGDRRPRD